MASAVTYTRVEDVVTLVIDDGRVNSFGFDLIRELNEALDRASREEGTIAVLLIGNVKAFSAGFDLKIMGAPPSAEQHRLFMEGARLSLRLFDFPRPVVIGCSGHALALGAIILLAADYRVGRRGPKFKIGLNEVAIGMTAPIFAVELARNKMPKTHFERSVVHAEVHTPDSAVAAGFLDVAVDETEFRPECDAVASRLAKLAHPGFANTKRYARREILRRIRATLEEDAARLDPSSSRAASRL